MGLKQDAHVLDRSDQVVLNLLPPKPPPTCPFEVMVVAGIGKALFHQLLSASAIPSRGVTVRLHTRDIEGCLFFVSLEGAAQLGSGALRSQEADRAYPRRGFILHRVAHPV